MITNSSMTLYHKNGIDVVELTETWTRYNIDNVWWFGGRGTNTNKGYENANDVQIRIPYNKNDNIDILADVVDIGDIVVKGHLNIDIEKQQDLENYEYYNITAINNNTFGSEPHIHLSGR